MLYVGIFNRDNSLFTSMPQFSIPSSIQSLSTQSIADQIFKDIPGTIFILGLFVGYCYFFHYLKTAGVNLLSNPSTEYQKMGISFFYSFLFCIGLTIFILVGTYLGYFGSITPTKIIESAFLIIFFVMTILIMTGAYFLLKKKAQLNYSDFPDLIKFFKEERFYQKFDAISRIMFVLSFLLILFCYIFNLNFLVLLSVNVLLLFLLWFLGVFNALPNRVSSITLTDKEEISDVYIIEPDGNYVLYLSTNNIMTRLNKDSILKISPKKDNLEEKGDKETERKNGVETRILGDASATDLLNFIGAFFAFLISFIFLFIQRTFLPEVVLFGYLIGFVLLIILIWLLKRMVYWRGEY